MKLKDLQKPTIRWTERMNDGDDVFTEKKIAATDDLLDEFMVDLEKLEGVADDSQILAVVKKLIKALNKQNRRAKHIETLEREELVDYVLTAAKIVGFSRDDDVTEEWRKW